MARDEVQALRLRLHAARLALERRDHALALVAHELRTPLNAVLGWAQMLSNERAETSGAMKRAAQSIGRNAQLQLRLVNDLLDRSLLVRGQLRLKMEAIDGAAVVDAALDVVRPTADAAGVTLLPRVTRPLAMHGDGERLQQVLVNLVMNAVTFSERGKSVVVTAHRQGNGVEMVVRDSGPGLENWLVPVIFDTFQRGRGREHAFGLGIGLSIAKSIVEMHGGTIRAENATGGKGGAIFHVVVPTHASGAAVAADAPRRRVRTSRRRTARC